MKTRLDVILETVSYILEVQKPKRSRIARLAAIRKRDRDRWDRIAPTLDAADRNAVLSYESDTRDPERDMRER